MERYRRNVEELRNLNKKLSDASGNTKRISELEAQIREYQERINKLTKEDRESMLMGSNIVNKFKEVVDNRMNFFHPNDDAWKELEQIIRQCLPLFTKKVMDGCLLGDQEQKVCILTRLGLHNGDIALLLDTSPQRVSNAKMKANLKLFDKQSASNLSDNLKDSEKLSL